MTPEQETPNNIAEIYNNMSRDMIPPELEALPEMGQERIPEPGDLTDVGNADRLVRQYGDRLHYIGEWGWIIFTGRRWQHDRNDLIMQFAKRTARHIYHEASEAIDDDRTKRLANWASRSLNRTRLDAMIDLAKSELPASPEEFDSDPWVLNVQNGLLDMRSGELRPHRPEDLITKIAGTYYDPAAQCPTFEGFLVRVLVDNETICFIRRAVGYALTGNVGEQVLFFLYGTGANGKSTFIRAILDMLGDYGRQSAPQFLMTGDRHPTEIADLQGARFVATIEVEEGRHMAEVLVKQLTGGDRIKARFMRRDFFEFDPQHKIFLAANHKPIIRGTDYAIWRRIRLIPFMVTIPPDEQDKVLGEKLRAELPGILAWAVRGCLEWQKNGLIVPAKIKQATDEYQTEMDIIAGFLADCCIVSSLASVTASAIYQAYKTWTESNGEKAMSHRAFSARLKERGFAATSRDGAGRWVYSGLGLLTKDDENA